jgi:DNA-directed RNA polymerase subunit RPC12/RpoP
VKLIRPPRRYAPVEAFYAELPDIDRRFSIEVDFGVWWTKPNEVWPHYRLSWVENTGELIEVELRGKDASICVLAVIQGRAAIEHVLYGWAQRCAPEGLRWVYRRLESLVPTYYCAGCFRAGGHTETTHDPEERCPRCNKRRWDETLESRANADSRRALRIHAGASR